MAPTRKPSKPARTSASAKKQKPASRKSGATYGRRAKTDHEPNDPAAKAGDSLVLMTGAQIAKALDELAARIVKDIPSPTGLMVLGIQTRGAFLAQRLNERLAEKYGVAPGFGTLDVTVYRDDFAGLPAHHKMRDSEIPFDVTGATVLLVDDVLFTGRTIRAAMDEIVDFGRPAFIRLATLVDRGCREYPIQADYCALTVKTRREQLVQVMLEEIDKGDMVLLREEGTGDKRPSAEEEDGA